MNSDTMTACIPAGDIIDRLSILIVSKENIKDTDPPHIFEYTKLFQIENRLSFSQKYRYLNFLTAVNRKMWCLEAAIRNPGERNLSEIGSIAVRLRDMNKIRVAIRNRIDSITQTNKIHHLVRLDEHGIGKQTSAVDMTNAHRARQQNKNFGIDRAMTLDERRHRLEA